jgi:chromosome segregation ATPase
MQRMGRNPPPVTVTRREDALSMVRSAMLLAAAFPELRAEALALGEQLRELMRLIEVTQDELRTEVTRLNDARAQLVALQESKLQALAERRKALADARQLEEEISLNASELADLTSTARDRVQAYRAHLDEARLRSNELQADVDRINAEREGVTARSVEVGGQIEQIEKQLRLNESKSAELEPQEMALRRAVLVEDLRAQDGRSPEAAALARELHDLELVIKDLHAEDQKLRAEAMRLNEERTRLDISKEVLPRSLAGRQQELTRMRETETEIARTLADWADLLAQFQETAGDRLGTKMPDPATPLGTKTPNESTGGDCDRRC